MSQSEKENLPDFISFAKRKTPVDSIIDLVDTSKGSSATIHDISEASVHPFLITFEIVSPAACSLCFDLLLSLFVKWDDTQSASFPCFENR